MANKYMKKKKLNITSHKGNTNENQQKTYFPLVRLVITKKTISTGKDVEKRNLLCVADGNIIQDIHY